MNLKKLFELEAETQQRLDIAPHEQDDPDMAMDLGNPGNPYVGSPPRVNTITPPLLSQTQWISTLPSPHYRVQIENAQPEITAAGDDLMLVMRGGTEQVFHNGITPVNVKGDQRMFRLTRDQAKALAVLLIKAASAEQ